MASVLVVAQAGDVPSWGDAFGADHALGVQGPDQPLIDDVAKARLVWRSDVPIPDTRCADGSDRLEAHTSISGGWSSPLAGDGRVYLCTYEPSGSVHDAGMLAKLGIDGDHPMARKWLIAADDVIHCFDAATGKTLWRRVFPDSGINYAQFNKGGCGSVPALSGGRLYWEGSAGRVFCVDAVSGEPVWTSDIGDRHQAQLALKAKCLQERRLPSYNRDGNGWLAVTGGVVVCNTRTKYKLNTSGKSSEFHYETENGLTGLDAGSGRRLWTVPGICGGRANGPLCWSNGGTDYVLGVPAGAPGAALIEARSGRVCWSEAPVCTVLHRSLVVGDLLLATKAVARSARDGTPTIGASEGAPLAAFRLSATARPEPVWELPEDLGGSMDAAVLDGRLYTISRPKQGGAGPGTLLCLELATGRILARQPIAIDLNYEHGNTFIAVWGDRLLLCDGHNTGALALAMWDAGTLQRLGGVLAPRLGGGYCMSVLPALYGGRAFVRHADHLACWEFRAALAHATPQAAPAPGAGR